MGQYYKPVSLEKQEGIYSHDYKNRWVNSNGEIMLMGNGLKLMEHSWIGNSFVGAVEMLIAEGGDWYGDRIVWAGDYADPEPETEQNLYSICKTVKKRHTKVKGFRYIINLETKEFVDKRKVPVDHIYTDKNGKEWKSRIHPLPLLTCEGNGRGGGDYHEENPLIGSWAGNRITVSKQKPSNEFTELNFDLVEHR